MENHINVNKNININEKPIFGYIISNAVNTYTNATIKITNKKIPNVIKNDFIIKVYLLQRYKTFM